MSTVVQRKKIIGKKKKKKGKNTFPKNVRDTTQIKIKLGIPKGGGNRDGRIVWYMYGNLAQVTASTTLKLENCQRVGFQGQCQVCLLLFVDFYF